MFRVLPNALAADVFEYLEVEAQQGAVAVRFDAGRSVLSVQSVDSRETTMFLASETEKFEPAAQTKLVFRQYGNRYFLRQVWMGGNSEGIELPKTRREIEVAMDYPSRDAILVARLR